MMHGTTNIKLKNMWVRWIAIENKYGISPNILFYVWTELKTKQEFNGKLFDCALYLFI